VSVVAGREDVARVCVLDVTDAVAALEMGAASLAGGDAEATSAAGVAFLIRFLTAGFGFASGWRRTGMCS
jgi:hypothetical protein